MRIVSDFDDYYDNQQSLFFGAMLNTVYFRKENKKLFLNQKLSNLKYFKEPCLVPSWSVSFFIVGFCEQITRGVRIRVNGENHHSYTFSGAVFIPKQLNLQLSDEQIEDIRHWFGEYERKDASLFKSFNTPCFVISTDVFGLTHITLDANLFNYCFYKVKSSCQAYSDLQRYIPANLSSKIINGFHYHGIERCSWSYEECLPEGY